jgi:hypothetical protein
MTIAPDDHNDIARIGRIAGDRLIEEQARRIDAMATEVRGLHIRLGHLLSAAMADAATGGGSNLEALTAIVGDVDVSELLEEFELRTVQRIENVQDVNITQIGKVVRR